MKNIITSLMLMFMLSPSTHAESDNFFIRPHLGIGYTDTSGNDGNGTAFHLGSRFLLSAGNRKYWGLEITYIDVDISQDEGPDTKYLATGIVLERQVSTAFNMSIGTIGYIGIGDNENNPFGIVTNLGWEPKGRVTPFVTFRSEMLFDDSTLNINSLSAGIRFRF